MDILIGLAIAGVFVVAVIIRREYIRAAPDKFTLSGEEWLKDRNVPPMPQTRGDKEG